MNGRRQPHKHAPKSALHRTKPRNFVRIVGGKWRGRHVPVADTDGLRPTPDRVRETLFNWLSPHIVGAHCLDLFAGSGALGFEALSRGAAHVHFVEQDRRMRVALAQMLTTLECRDASIAQHDAFTLLDKAGHDPANAFDLVFIDPPFSQAWQAPVLAALAKSALLQAHAHLYVESNSTWDAQALPDGMELLRAKSAGLVRYHLISWQRDGQA
jgi:16S rRNA (guanine966-N2)-methyltransferase